MAKESGGALVHLEKVPLKYPGLEPWEIWISESQERMTLAVPKNKWKRLSELLKKRGVEASIIGEFTNSGKCIVKFKGKKIMDINMQFLHDGLPEKPMSSRISNVSSKGGSASGGKYPISNFKEPKDYEKTILQMLSRLNISSY